MKISDFVTVNTIVTDMESTTKKEALTELTDILAANGKITDKDAILSAIIKREELGTTGIGQGIAIPHAKTDIIDNIYAVLGISKKGIEFKSLDGERVYIVFLFIVPNESAGQHLKILAKASQLLKDKFFREPLKAASSAKEVLKLIKNEEQGLC